MIRHFAGIGEIVDDIEGAVRFYGDVLGLRVEHQAGEQYATVAIPGICHYGLWGRTAAAESVYGPGADGSLVSRGPVIGLEVDDVDAAAEQIVRAGGRLVQAPQTEPWGQRTARFLLPSGMLAEVCETPWARELGQADGST